MEGHPTCYSFPVGSFFLLDMSGPLSGTSRKGYIGLTHVEYL